MGLLILSVAAYADNYDAAKKLMEMDKEVRDYQQCKINNGSWCRSGNSESSDSTGILQGIFGVTLAIGAIVVFYIKIKEFFEPRVSPADKVPSEVKGQMVADYMSGQTVEEISRETNPHVPTYVVIAILAREGVYKAKIYSSMQESTRVTPEKEPKLIQATIAKETYGDNPENYSFLESERERKENLEDEERLEWLRNVKCTKFSGSISTTTLTVTDMQSECPVVTGMYVNVDTYITHFGTGSGGAGTYLVSKSQNLESQTIVGVGDATSGDPPWLWTWLADFYGNDANTPKKEGST